MQSRIAEQEKTKCKIVEQEETEKICRTLCARSDLQNRERLVRIDFTV